MPCGHGCLIKLYIKENCFIWENSPIDLFGKKVYLKSWQEKLAEIHEQNNRLWNAGAYNISQKNSGRDGCDRCKA